MEDKIVICKSEVKIIDFLVKKDFNHLSLTIEKKKLTFFKHDSQGSCGLILTCF